MHQLITSIAAAIQQAVQSQLPAGFPRIIVGDDIRKLKEVLIHRVGAASVNLSQLLRAEKLFLLDKS